MQKNRAFTLVELIIVITILAILATIGFMSYQSYTIDARDGKRKTDLGEIRNALELYQLKNTVLPTPDEKVIYVVTLSLSNIILYQGFLGQGVQKQIKATNDIKDYKDNFYYTYTTNSNKSRYELMSYLENKQAMNSNLIKETYASFDYEIRTPYVIGNYLSFFSGVTNTPLQESLTTNTGILDLASSSQQYKLIASGTGFITSTGTSIPSIISTLTNSSVSNDSGQQLNTCGTDTLSVGRYTYNTKFLAGKCWTLGSMKHGSLLSSRSSAPSNVNTIEKWCPMPSGTSRGASIVSSNCDTYSGALYTWYEAMGLASSDTLNTVENTSKSVCGQLGTGWHLPSNSDFDNLVAIPSTGWLGNKLSGLISSLLGYSNSGGFIYLSSVGYWWTSTWSSSSNGSYRSLDASDSIVVSSNNSKVYGYSVICVKN
ncbi:MAG: prepilin-type N-terminal cleavage/methylation domain-containing protein [Candidatus Gracilibacteria bacterium]|nr:prepilin-type N-terminal cleavage/methylation domain-containing protein [Candidatus Gracilibacteria bacterium]